MTVCSSVMTPSQALNHACFHSCHSRTTRRHHLFWAWLLFRGEELLVIRAVGPAWATIPEKAEINLSKQDAEAQISKRKVANVRAQQWCCGKSEHTCSYTLVTKGDGILSGFLQMLKKFSSQIQISHQCHTVLFSLVLLKALFQNFFTLFHSPGCCVNTVSCFTREFFYSDSCV